MKVRICYTVEVDDDTRRRINMFYDKDGLATREEVKQWYYMHGQSAEDDLADMKIEEREGEE